MRYEGRSSTRGANEGILQIIGTDAECTCALFDLFGVATFHPLERAGSFRRVGFAMKPFGKQLMEVVFARIPSSWELRTAKAPEFGVLRPVLQKFFPDWKSSLKVRDSGFRDGVFEFKVSLGRIWRRIAISAESSLDELADTILKAVEFDDDHLYEFRLRTGTAGS